ncbi:MAG: amidase [Chloroflexi bacterium]|nr:amidase [Chloroflexota bacterium]MCC6895419.1 amidase [Anaerolineae bacterium]
MDSEIIYTSVVQLAKAIQTKAVSSVEVVQAHLKRIEEINPTINAVVQLRTDEALEEARQADEALARGESKGLLHGVPMTIKDSLDTAGVITTGGTLGRKDFVPQRDATVVKRLKNEGAILMGKTNTPELTTSLETNNVIYGRTNNPYDLTRTSGGSSGGAAAIITTGGAPFDIGSDYGGSIRLPAHFCGIAGIKPTSGRVPRTGHIMPYALGATDAYQTIGPLARTVDDLTLLLGIIEGPDWEDPAIVPMPPANPNAVDLGKLRIAFYTDNGTTTPTPEIMQTVKAVAQALEGHVASVTEDRPKRLAETWDLWTSLNVADGGYGTLEILEKVGTQPNARHLAAAQQEVSGREFGKRLREMDLFRSQMLGFMANYDVIICPVNANVAIKHDTLWENFAGFSYASTYNLTGWPAAVVRAGTSPEGLPISVQIVANPWREDVALKVARFVEENFGGWQKLT